MNCVSPEEVFVRSTQGYLEKAIQTPMAQGRSTEIISMMKWIETSRFSIQNSFSFREDRRSAVWLGMRVSGLRVEWSGFGI